MIDPKRVEDLLARCELEDSNPPERRFLYTNEIRQLLGVQPMDPDPYRALADGLRQDQERNP